MRFGSTPLHCSARKGHYDIVVYLVNNGADIHSKDKNFCTALHFSESEGHKSISRYLIQKGADIKAKTITGQTFLEVTNK